MEEPLRLSKRELASTSRYQRRNPYYNGRASKTRLLCYLVVRGYYRRNPYYNGRASKTLSEVQQRALLGSRNPYYNGRASKTVAASYHNPFTPNVAILIIMEEPLRQLK